MLPARPPVPAPPSLGAANRWTSGMPSRRPPRGPPGPSWRRGSTGLGVQERYRPAAVALT
eukprot:349801-Chlamydomonas_euryale.AAC.72